MPAASAVSPVCIVTTVWYEENDETQGGHLDWYHNSRDEQKIMVMVKCHHQAEEHRLGDSTCLK